MADYNSGPDSSGRIKGALPAVTLDQWPVEVASSVRWSSVQASSGGEHAQCCRGIQRAISTGSLLAGRGAGGQV